jgi:hypothetical protein
MMIGRRRFLKLMGVSTAAAPMAAKAAADREALKLTTPNYNTPLSGNLIQAPQAFNDATQDQLIRQAEHVRLFGLPRHIEASLRERAAYVSCLDADLVVKRSWSFSVKIQEQRQRNYRRLVEGYEKAGWYERAQKTFAEMTGIKWQW